MAPLDLYIASFNCGRVLVDVDVFAASLFKDDKGRSSTPDIVFLALQEVAPIAYSFIGGALLAPYFAPFLQAVNKAAGAPDVYRHLITHNVGMTAIVVFLKSEVSESLQWLQTAEVGVGWSEMGNKGAAAVRIGWKSSDMHHTIPLTLVAAHLAPMEDQCQRRNEDWENIVRRLTFKSPTTNTASLSKAIPPAADEAQVPLLGESPDAIPSPPTTGPLFIPGSPVFFAGDLNYRTGDVGPTPETVTPSTFPQPRPDPSYPAHWANILPQDQLTRERTAGRTLHTLAEAPIDFPPTYKFSEKQQEATSRQEYFRAGEPPVYHWSSHRLPSWCDRVLFSADLFSTSAPALTIHSYTALGIQPTSDHRPVALSASLDLEAAAKATAAQSQPFAVDPSAEARRIAARRSEIALGLFAYLGMTWEGNALLGGSAIGVVGAWLMFGSFLGG